MKGVTFSTMTDKRVADAPQVRLNTRIAGEQRSVWSS
jgi:hypothetical protein